MSNKTTKGLMLRSVEGVLMQVVQFVLQMVLARILMPEDFGIVAILATFINVANTMVNSGLSSALLQRKKFEDVDVCTVFYIEFGISILMYGIIFACAPLISSFYNIVGLTAYLRVFAISIILGGLSSIQLTVARYKLNFKPGLIASVSGVVVQSVVGITMALSGFGVWSLIASSLSYYAVRTLLMIIQVRWIPSLKFSYKSFKNLFGYSWRLFVGWMIGTLYNDAFSWIIGKKYDASTLGYYSKGQSIPSIVNRVVTQTTRAVMFPAIAKNQDDLGLVKKQTRLMISVTAAMVLPVMAGVAGAARSIILILLTEKWALAIPVVQLMCIPLALNMLGNANVQSYNAIGRSDIFMKTEMLKRSLTIVLVLVFMNIDYYLMLASIGIGGVVAMTINAICNRRLLKYKLREYLIDFLPYLVISLALFVGVYLLGQLSISVYLCFILQLVLCAVVYFGMILSGALPAYKMIRKALFSFMERKKVNVTSES